MMLRGIVRRREIAVGTVIAMVNVTACVLMMATVMQG